jgi:demethylmenaquinone methyltransferase/2-methoxy-6-polyprenyl-1,4-benzoquinol methylase
MNEQKKIIEMFDKTANTYDVLNMILSLGIDKIWRRNACDKAYELLAKDVNIKIADVACGSGDMSITWQKRANKNGYIVENITGIDPSKEMLKVAKTKTDSVEFVNSEAKSLPFEDKSIDIVSITYGIRNVVDRGEAFKEFNRVLKKEAVLVILEFTNNKKTNLWDIIKDFYMKNIIPIIGSLISKDKEAYKYLPESIDKFLSKKMLKQELEESGFDVIYLKSSLNISSCFIARKK